MRTWACPGGCRPPNDFENPLLGLGDRRAAFDPIAGVDIDDFADLAHGGVVNMAADHPLGAVTARLLSERRFELADIVHRALDPVLEIGRERPVGHAQPAANGVEMGVGPQRKRVAPIAEQREPFGVADDDVEFIAVHDEIAAPVGSLMDRLALDGDAPEPRPAIIAHRFIVIAGNVDQLRPLARLAQQFLQDVVVGLRPVDAALDAPEVDNVADQVELRGVVAAQEVDEGLGLAGPGAQMQIRDEDCAIAPHPRLKLHVVFPASSTRCVRSYRAFVSGL